MYLGGDYGGGGASKKTSAKLREISYLFSPSEKKGERLVTKKRRKGGGGRVNQLRGLYVSRSFGNGEKNQGPSTSMLKIKMGSRIRRYSRSRETRPER